MMIGEQAHLGLTELTGLANGAPLEPAAGAHLAGCPHCQAEARSWTALAAGVRTVMAESRPPDPLPEAVLAAIGGGGSAAGPPAHRGWPGWRPAVAAAAAVVVLGGTSLGIATTLAAGGGGGRPEAAVLTATSCAHLKLVVGTLQSVSGSTLLIRSAIGPAVRVTTSGSTKVAREVTGTLADVHAGMHVIVSGTRSHGRIAAQRIGVTSSSLGMKPPLPVQGRPAALVLGVANGTVAAVTTGGFTAAEPGGTHVRVSTSSSTTVVMLASVTVAQLRTGQRTVAVGSVTGKRELAARTVEQESLPFSQFRPFPLPPPARFPRLAPSGLRQPSGYAQPSPLRNGYPRPAGLPGILPSPGALFSGLGCNAPAIAATGLLAFGS